MRNPIREQVRVTAAAAADTVRDAGAVLSQTSRTLGLVAAAAIAAVIAATVAVLIALKGTRHV
jgi:hypothetical protein